MRVIGTDEHVWRHGRTGGKYVTVVIDLTPVRAGTGPARLLEVRRDGRVHRVQDRYCRGATRRRRGDGPLPRGPPGRRCAGPVPAAGPERPARTPWTGTRPALQARRILHTGSDLLKDKQKAIIAALFATDEHVEVEATWQVYQTMISAYRDKDPTAGRERMTTLITSISTGVPAALVDVRRLGRTIKRRAADVLAHFEPPGTSNGPTEAINGRLEHLRGTALGSRNLTNYITRCLPEAGGFRPVLHLPLR